MRRFPLYHVDAFTDRPFTGNAAAVVLGADSLGTAEMQSIAREMNLSETVFVLSPDGDDHECRLRYFTPTVEVPTCGHATVAAHYVRAVTSSHPGGRIWHKIGVGRLPIDIEQADGVYRIMMTQAMPVISAPYSAEQCERILGALGLDEQEIDPRCPILQVSTGHPKIMVGVKSRTALDAMAPDMRALVALAEEIPNGGCFLFCLSGTDSDIYAHARMFAPNIGIPEDPVTGNGNGPLGAYLVHHRLIPPAPVVRFSSRQGEAMGRPGTADVEVDMEEGRPVRVRAGGRAVIVFEAELRL